MNDERSRVIEKIVVQPGARNSEGANVSDRLTIDILGVEPEPFVIDATEPHRPLTPEQLAAYRPVSTHPRASRRDPCRPSGISAADYKPAWSRLLQVSRIPLITAAKATTSARLACARSRARRTRSRTSDARSARCRRSLQRGSNRRAQGARRPPPSSFARCARSFSRRLTPRPYSLAALARGLAPSALRSLRGRASRE
jgi:hypothetical protein